MNLGNKLLALRKSKQLSQEEVSEKLGVSRQTISKWETDQSTPDFDKIVPLCNLYGITPNELLTQEKGTKKKAEDTAWDKEYETIRANKKAKGISIGVFLYFIAIIWIMVSFSVFSIDPIISTAIFLLICAIATYFIVYVCIMYKKDKTEKEKHENKLRSQIEQVVAIVTTIVYLIISFSTMAWHITWIIWVVYGLFCEILKLIFMLRGIEDEK